MTLTLEERRRMLLKSLGLTWEEVLQADVASVMEKALAYLKTDNGYELVSPPQGSRKKWQARTSGKGIGQRDLGSFTTAEEAGTRVAQWILGIFPTPPTPSRVKPDRNHRDEGKRKVKRDRCNHGKGALLFSLLGPLSHTDTFRLFLAGGPDLRTSEYRPKKAKRALEQTVLNAGLPLAAQWPSEEELDAMVCSVELLQPIPAPAGTGVLAQRTRMEDM